MNLVLSIIRDLIILLLCCVSIAAAVYTFTTKRLVLSVLYFVQLVISLSLALFLYKPLYISVLYIIVYIGAVAVLFLFVLMLVNLRNEYVYQPPFKWRNLKLSGFIRLAFMLTLMLLMLSTFFNYLDFSSLNGLALELQIWASFNVEQGLDNNLKNLYFYREKLYPHSIWVQLINYYSFMDVTNILSIWISFIDVNAVNLHNLPKFITLFYLTLQNISIEDFIELTTLALFSSLKNNFILYNMPMYLTYLPTENNLNWLIPLFTVHVDLLFSLAVILFIALIGTILTSNKK